MSRPQEPSPKGEREHHNPQPPKPQGGVDPKVARAAALAAAEARLRPPKSPTSPTDPSTSTSTSTSNTNTSDPSSTTTAGGAGGQANAKIEKWTVSEKGDGEKRKEYQRLLYRGVVRDNGYKQASECVETLIKVAGNILENPDQAKFRELRALNSTIKNRILDIKGGHEYLIALGFRTRTVNFEKQYILEPTLKRMHELKIGHEVLSEAAPEVKARVTGLSSSNTNHSSDEATRRARALAEYEADRDLVKERVRREQQAREAREALEAEKARAARMEEEDEGEGNGDGGWRPLELGGYEDEGDGLGGMERLNPEGNQDADQRNNDDDDPNEDEDDDGDGDEEDMGRGDFRDPDRSRWGRGNRLGGQ